MKNKYLLGGLILLLVVVGAIAFYSKNQSNNQTNNNQNNNHTSVETNFKHSGNLAKNNPGLKPDTWYLVYEEPGQAALSRELKFTTEPANLVNGLRVYIEGHEENGVVQVTTFQIDKSDLIRVTSPTSDDTVKSPLAIKGEARGSWYFEAVFPIKLLDANGKVLGQTQGRAQGSWQTTNFVPFTATLTFTTPTTDTGTLVLEKDNPSGLPANADELRIPLRLQTSTQSVKLYYYNPKLDKDASGNVLCSSQGLVAVDREIPKTITPIQDTIKLLLLGQLTAAEKAQGITTEFPLAGVSLLGANLSQGILTLEFADPQNKTGGGSCRVTVLWKQIEATAKQFAGVTTVKFKPDTLFQP